MPTKKAKTSKNTSKRRRCSRGFHFDKKSQVCKEFRKIVVFKDLNDQEISETKNTFALESLGDAGAILKIYKKGNLVTQGLVHKKMLDESREDGLKQSKTILRNLTKAKNNPFLMKRDKKFQKFLRMFSEGSPKGGPKGKMMGGSKDEDPDILIQKEVYDQLSTNKVETLQNKIKMLEGDLNKERGAMLASFSGSMGLLSLFGLLTHSDSAIEASGDIKSQLTEIHADDTYIRGYITPYEEEKASGLNIGSNPYEPDIKHLESVRAAHDAAIYTDKVMIAEPIGFLVSFILDLTLGMFPSEPVFWLDMMLKYALYTTVFLTIPGWLWGFPFGYISATIGVLLSTSKIITYVTREKSARQKELEKELQKAREDLVDTLRISQ